MAPNETQTGHTSPDASQDRSSTLFGDGVLNRVKQVARGITRRVYEVADDAGLDPPGPPNDAELQPPL